MGEVTQRYHFLENFDILQRDIGSFNTLPDEMLLKIFKYIPSTHKPVLSLVCKTFLTFDLMKPSDYLVCSKTVEFIQKNGIREFKFRAPTPTDPALIITGDWGEYKAQPRIKIWQNGQAPISEKASKSFFRQPIHLIEICGTNSNFLIVSQDNCEGRVQVWDLNKEKIILQTKLKKKITSLHAYQNEILIAFENGEIYQCTIKDLSTVKKWKAHDLRKEIEWMSHDPSLNRIFTASQTQLKIWDSNELSCIKELSLKTIIIIYSTHFNYLIGSEDHKSITIWSGKNGAEVMKFSEIGEDLMLSALHLDETTGLLFGAFDFDEKKIPQNKIVVWNINTNEKMNSFLTIYKKINGFPMCTYVHQLDYDPETEWILTGGGGLRFWDLKTGLLVTSLKLPSSALVSKMLWDKQAKTLIVQATVQNVAKLFIVSPFKMMETHSELSQ